MRLCFRISPQYFYFQILHHSIENYSCLSHYGKYPSSCWCLPYYCSIWKFLLHRPLSYQRTDCSEFSSPPSISTPRWGVSHTVPLVISEWHFISFSWAVLSSTDLYPSPEFSTPISKWCTSSSESDSTGRFCGRCFLSITTRTSSASISTGILGLSLFCWFYPPWTSLWSR